MSGIELAALAGLIGMYADSRYGLIKDALAIKSFIGSNISGEINTLRGIISVWYVFEKHVNNTPNNLFLVYPKPRFGQKLEESAPLDDMFDVLFYTYRQTYDIVLRYSSYFYNELGVRPGDTVAMDFVNKDEFIFVWLALWNLGAIPAFINYNLQSKALLHCVRVARTKLFIVDDEVSENGEMIENELKELGIRTVYSNKEFLQKVHDSHPFRLDDRSRGVPTLSDAACLIYTSGTTGLPKAAIMSWKKAHHGAQLYQAIVRLRRDDVVYSAMPLYHSTAAVLGFLSTLMRGGAFAVGHKFSTRSFWTQVRLCGATAIQYVGETGRYLLSAPPSPDERRHKVRMALGNGLRPDVWAKFKERFNIGIVSEFYGATEFPAVIVNNQHGDYGIGAVAGYGAVATWVMRKSMWDIAAVDPETQHIWRDAETGFGRRTRPGESGEFVFKLPAKALEKSFQGYVGDKKATSEKVARNLFAEGDAWLRTGDLLRRNKDNLVYFVDRLGDTFRWKSENVSTNEVENVIAENPAVEMAVVVGVAVPNHEGRAGLAVIQPAHENQLPDLRMLAQELMNRLPRYAVPVFVKFVHTIDRTGNNKVMKNKFRNQQIPSDTETIYWLDGTEYVPLTQETWLNIEAGTIKL